MKQLNLKLLTTLGLTSSAIISCSTHEQTRPNIIYIMSDDHAYQAISTYGGPLKNLAPTPSIDRIAQNGMRFDRCLVTNSISGPCRAVVLTGKYSHLN
ncbi:MAG: sulfatase-like hydrolase/transferase, partial [Bacteroidia bacterium]|nr:sulfatase-like hydrolase/transferase [Bacteroidia bacterium]